MKKIICVLALIALVTSCTVIDTGYTGRRIVTEPMDDYGYTPTYGSYYSPTMLSGWYGWWNPFWLYGYYNSYGGPYNPYFRGWYSSGSRSTFTGKTVITKRQLSKGTTRTLSKGRVIKGAVRTIRSGTRSTVSRTGSSGSRSSGTRSTISRSGSSRSTSSRSRSSSSGSKTSTRVKK